MKLIRKGPVWAVDFRDPSGKRQRISTGIRIPSDPAQASSAEAEAYAEAAKIVQRSMAASAPGSLLPSAQERTLAEVLERQFRNHWSRMAYGTTMKHIVRLLVREMGYLPISKITYEELATRAEGWLKAGLAHSTINQRLVAIGFTLRECKKLGELQGSVPEVPHFRINPYAKERYLEEAEEKRLLSWMEAQETDAAVDERPEWTYMKHFTVFLVDSGFRFSEAFKFTLEGDQADLKHGCTKTTIGRRVPLTERALAAAKFLLASPHHHELDRRTTTDQPKIAWDWVAHRFQRACYAMAINTKETPRNQRVTIHTLRHTCASRLVQRGIDLYIVCKWLGHSSIKTTMRYAKLAPDTFKAARDVLSKSPS